MKLRYYLSIFFSLFALVESAIGSASYHRPEDRWLDERPRPVSILTYPIQEGRLPPICQSSDFERPCSQRDHACKTRKEQCGDAISADFTEEMLSLSLQGLTIHDGKYSGNKGLDDWRSWVVQQQRYHLVTENKADKSRLNPKTNKGSGRWIQDIGQKLGTAGKLSEREKRDFQQDLDQGRVIRTLAHVDVSKRHPTSGQFRVDYKPMLASDPYHREKELYTYCTAVHPQMVAYSATYDRYQTAE